MRGIVAGLIATLAIIVAATEGGERIEEYVVP